MSTPQLRYYYRNREKYYASTRRRQARNAAFLSRWKAAAECIDCGYTDPRALDFDHVRGIKDRSLAEMSRASTSLAKLAREIEKCDVRCANCHRIVTAERKQ